MSPVLEADALQRFYRAKRVFRRATEVRAVDCVSFTLHAGRTLAVVGESGCGKSTLARMLALLDTPTAGQIRIDGKVASADDPATRRAVQMVFQDPYSSLNPRQTVAAILEEPLLLAGESAVVRREAALAMMNSVGLRPDQLGRYPHQFSGGQRQRIAIARALMLRPKVVIADEPVSALDVSVRAQVLNVLIELQDRLGLAYVFISHDLGVVRHVADEVAVMYLGRIVEQASRDVLFADPRHPYTRALLAATPGTVPRADQPETVYLAAAGACPHRTSVAGRAVRRSPPPLYWLCRVLLASIGTLAAADASSQTVAPPVTDAQLARIQHILVIYAENRSFDHLYGMFPGANGLARRPAGITRCSTVWRGRIRAAQTVPIEVPAGAQPDPRFLWRRRRARPRTTRGARMRRLVCREVVPRKRPGSPSATVGPPLRPVGPGWAACHLVEELAARS